MTGQGRSSGNPLRTFLRRFLLCFALVIAAAPCSTAAAGTTVVQPALTAAATAIHAYDLLPRRVAARLGSDAGGTDQWRNEQRDTAELPRAPSLGSPLRQQFVIAAEGEGGGLLAGLKGRYRAVRMGGGDAGSISLGGAEFSDDEIAQLTYQHIGAGDIAGRPALDEISAALAKGERVPLEGQNGFKYEYGGVRVIVNGDAPWRSTAYYPGR